MREIKCHYSLLLVFFSFISNRLLGTKAGSAEQCVCCHVVYCLTASFPTHSLLLLCEFVWFLRLLLIIFVFLPELVSLALPYFPAFLSLYSGCYQDWLQKLVTLRGRGIWESIEFRSNFWHLPLPCLLNHYMALDFGFPFSLCFSIRVLWIFQLLSVWPLSFMIAARTWLHWGFLPLLSSGIISFKGQIFVLLTPTWLWIGYISARSLF